MKKNVKNIYALTPLAAGMLYHYLYDPSSSTYFQQMCFTISGRLDLRVLEDSWNELLKRHDALRTVFVYKGVPEPLQIVLKERRMNFKYVDLSLVNPEESGLERWKEEDRNSPFNLTKDTPMRVTVLRTGQDLYEVIWSFHHILMDGWCVGIIQEEFFEIYSALISGKAVTLPPAAPYGVYIKWLKKHDAAAAAQYWKERLAGYWQSTSLPWKKQDYRPKPYLLKTVTVEADEAISLSTLASTLGITVVSVLKALWAVLLGKYNSVSDVVFGLVVSGRPSEIPSIERMIGLFINTIPVRVTFSGRESFISLARRIQDESIEDQSNEHYSLADIAASHPLKTSLFDHILVFENYPVSEPGDGVVLPGGGSVKSSGFFEQTNYPLEVSILPGKTLRFSFDANIYSENDINATIGHLLQLALCVCKDPSISIADMDMLTGVERHEILYKFNGSDSTNGTSTITDTFQRQALLRPDKTAVVSDGRPFSFSQLNAMSNRLAHHLRNTLGVRPGDLAGIMMERSEWLVAGILGILKASAAYVPIDPGLPLKRILYIVGNSGCKVVVTSDRYVREFSDTLSCVLCNVTNIEEGGASNPPKEITPESPAYVTYTSGSTGNPKGVVVTHSNVVSFSANMAGVFGLTSADRIYALTTVIFDISVLELIESLLIGMTVVLSQDAETAHPHRILQTLRESAITAFQVTPSRLKLLLDGSEVDALNTLRVLIIGGEPLPADLFERMKPLFGTVNVFNVYGPTETTIWSTGKRLNDGVLNIGRPLLNEAVYILSADGSLLPREVPGEICIGGAGVSRGYYNQERLTADKFIENPRIGRGRIYRTGDLGRWLSTGELECLGRTDDQLKIRGYRVEPGEIEARIKGHSSVRDAAVIATATDSTEKELVAFTILNNTLDRELNELQLRDYLSLALPDYMIPTSFEFIDKFPYTANGKIDRKTLSTYRTTAISATQECPVAPRNSLETVIASIWQSVLGRQGIGIRDNFFTLGGHSLKAMLIMSKIHRELSIELTLREIMENPTVQSLAGILSRKTHSALDEIQPVHNSGVYPLSHSQRRMWVLEQMDEAAGAYNMITAYLLEGELDISVLARALKILVERHNALTNTLAATNTGTPRQAVKGSAGFSLQTDDISGTADALDAARLMVEEEALRPMELFKGPLFVAKHILLSENKHVLIIKAHHIVCDGWSFGIIMRELKTIYEALLKGSHNHLAPLKIDYGDYVAWQGSPDTLARIQKDRQYWLQRFSPSSEIVPLRLPFDFPRPHKQSFRGKTVSRHIDAAVSERLLLIGKTQGAGAFSVFVVILKALLCRYCGQKDIIIGTPVTGRTHPELQGQVGLYVNTVVLRDKIDGSDNFIALLKKIKTTVAGAFDHQSYPFDSLVGELTLPRDINRHPLFDVMAVFDEDEEQPEESPDVFGERVMISELPFDYNVTKFDLTFHFTKKHGIISLNINYATAMFMEGTITSMAANFATLAASFSGAPLTALKHLQFVSDEQTRVLLDALAGFDVPFPTDKTIVDVFIERAANCADRTAITTKGGDVSYAALNHETDALADILVKRFNVKRGDMAAVILPRGRALVTAVLGVLKAGAVYLPLDTNFPYERLDYVLRDSACKVILTESGLPVYAHLKGTYEDIEVVDLLNLSLDEAANYRTGVLPAGGLAYVIYTSGSTGRPKGVMVEHAGFVNMALEQVRIFAIDKTDRVLQFASPSFDASMSEIFMALFAGAALVPVEERYIRDPSGFAAFVRQYGVTVATIPPVYMQTLERDALSTIKTVITAGEAANVNATLEIAKSSRCFNAYGPTEASVCAAIHEIGREARYANSIPIGKPIANVYVYVLDENMNLLPVGVTGEICISGVCLARGYLNNEPLTAEVFTDNPFKPGYRLYRTGDLGRWLHTGELEFLGRKDDQVKIRGYRVEPLEVERALASFPSIKKASVVAVESPEGNALAAYFTSDEILPVAALKEYMRKTLPDYMIPAHLIQIDGLPVTISGKVDKKLLPPVGRAAMPSTTPEYRKPHTALEAAIASLWELAIGRADIGIHDNFFDIGGNSISAIALASKLRERFDPRLPLTIIFEYQTIYALASGIENVEGFYRSIDTNTAVLLNEDGAFNVYFLPPLTGYAFVYRGVAKKLKAVTVYGFNYIASADVLSIYAAEIKKIQSGSPCILIGHSSGGNLAFELSRLLNNDRIIVTDVILIDSYRRVKKSCLNNVQREDVLREHYESFFSHLSGSTAPGELVNGQLVKKIIMEQMAHYAGYVESVLNDGITASNLHMILSTDEITEAGHDVCHYMERNWSGCTRRGRYVIYKGYGRHAEMLSGFNAEKNISLVQAIIDGIVRQRYCLI
ncbi:MAG: amino acid adenylation domain-containing protein [Nitrospirae bacterium]|nr:amino acid adenylation domain-containing protein [Nitrospirota bacterium]